MKKQGFTLIELLAVIVILAVIALISTPLITNTIQTSRENADRESARSYVSTVKQKITEAMLEYPNLVITENGMVEAKDDDSDVAGKNVRRWPCTNCSTNNYVDIEFSGTAPQKATLSWSDEGEVTGMLKYVNGCWKVVNNGDLEKIAKDTSDSTAKTFCGY